MRTLINFMSSKFDSYQKRRLRSSYFSVVISIALVLFMVGFLGLVLLKSTQVANHFKEEVVITLFLKNDTSKEQIENLRTSLLKELFTRKIIYISKFYYRSKLYKWFSAWARMLQHSKQLSPINVEMWI